MGQYKKLSRVIYKCDYHFVWVLKYRLRILKGGVKNLLESDIRMLCEWKGCDVQELNVQEDHIHLFVSGSPKISISVLMGFLKGESAIKLFKNYPNLKKKPYRGNHFWARGYFVSTVGLDEEMIRRYVRNQENKEHRVEDQQKRFDF